MPHLEWHSFNLPACVEPDQICTSRLKAMRSTTLHEAAPCTICKRWMGRINHLPPFSKLKAPADLVQDLGQLQPPWWQLGLKPGQVCPNPDADNELISSMETGVCYTFSLRHYTKPVIWWNIFVVSLPFYGAINCLNMFQVAIHGAINLLTVW